MSKFLEERMEKAGYTRKQAQAFEKILDNALKGKTEVIVSRGGDTIVVPIKSAVASVLSDTFNDEDVSILFERKKRELSQESKQRLFDAQVAKLRAKYGIEEGGNE